MVFRDFQINFGITCGKYCINFSQSFWDFLHELVKILEVSEWNFGKISRKFWKNLRKIEKKILNDFKKIMKTLLKKINVFEINIVNTIKKF